MNAPHRGLYGRVWWRIAGAPHRLLLFSATLHALLLLAFSVLLQIPLSLSLLSSLFFYGIAGIGLLGFLLQYLPRWLDTSPVDYGSYGASYNLAFIGMLVAQLGALYSSMAAIQLGMLLLALAWLVAASALKWRFRWSLRGAARLHRVLAVLLYLVPVSLLLNMGCALFSGCGFSPVLLLFKDLLLLTLLLMGFIAERPGFRMHHG